SPSTSRAATLNLTSSHVAPTIQLSGVVDGSSVGAPYTPALDWVVQAGPGNTLSWIQLWVNGNIAYSISVPLNQDARRITLPQQNAGNYVVFVRTQDSFFNVAETAPLRYSVNPAG